MPKFYNVYEEMLGDTSKKVSLEIGAPGPHILRDVASIMKEATIKHFDCSNPRNEEILQYGCFNGNCEMLEELSKFLSETYRNPVKMEDMFIHNGASQAIANVMYHYFQRGETLFVGDPSYRNFVSTLQDESSFKIKSVGIKLDEDGFNVDELEKQLHTLGKMELSERYPFRAAVYVIPVHHNPTGRILSQDRCKKLVKLARKYDLLIISDDAYNVLTYSAPDCDDPAEAKPPVRLFCHDKKSDADYKGNVVSIGSMSKSVAPGLSLGWFEMPERILHDFQAFFVTYSGSAWNAYTSGIVASAFKLGLMQEHIKKLRVQYKDLMYGVHYIIIAKLNKHGVVCHRPNGGVFMWIELPKQFCTCDLQEKCNSELNFAPGIGCSISKSHGNCLRISIAYYERDMLLPAVSKLCDHIENFIKNREH